MVDGDSRQYEVESALVWDLPVRIFHWSLVIAFIAAFVTDKLGVAYFKYHVWCGYTVLVLVAFRCVWGLVGTRHARFWNFVRGPAAIWRYLRGTERHFAGHNPLGALMVLVLLSGLLVQAVTGLFGNDEIFNVGPLYGYISNELSLRLTSLHRQLFYWIAGAIGIHIVAVLAYRLAKKDKLIEAMFTGRKVAVPRDEVIETSRTLLAASIVITVSAFLTWLLMSAPVAVNDISY
jgi:cytochrome b